MNFKLWLINEEEKPVTMTADIPMPPEITLLNKIFKKYDKKLYAVGGAIRDFLVNQFHFPSSDYSPKDVDITTDATPDKITEILNSPESKENNIKVLPKGEEFGVISAIINGKEFEIATFRSDYYDPELGDGRRPDKVQFSSPEEDAKRRDLTINALFYDIDKKEIIDYNQGQGLEDVKNLNARMVGDPNQRFQEDKLRILRLIRFFSRFNPNPIISNIDQKTLEAIQKFKDLKGISPERINAEFTNGFKSALNKKTYLQNYSDLDLFNTIFKNLIVNTNQYQQSDSLPATLAFILQDNKNPQEVRAKLNTLKYPNELSDKVELLLMLNDMDQYNILTLIKKRNIIKNVTNDIIEFAKLTNNKNIHKFADYQQQTKSQDFMHLKGPDINKAMNQKEKEIFNS